MRQLTTHNSLNTVDRVEFFKQQEAARRPLIGNVPLMLTETRQAWLVESGGVDVFVVELKEGKPAGNLIPLTHYDVGTVFFGLQQGDEPQEGESGRIGIMARGIPGTVVHGLAPDQLYPFADDAGKQLKANILSDWAGACLDSITDKPLLGRMQQGAAALLDVASGVNLSHEERIVAGLDSFHHLYLDLVLEQFTARQEQLHAHILEKNTAAKAVVSRGMRKLAAILNTGRKQPIITGQDEDPLLVVCQEVGRLLNLTIRPPHRAEDEELEQAPDPLLEIARASRVRTRQIILTDNWWTQDCGPLIAFLQEDDRPVALIPQKPGRYELKDPSGSADGIVDADMAGSIKPVAHMMYRPFPDEKLNWRDLVRFGLAGKKQDVVRMVLMGAAGGIIGTFVPLATGILFDSVIPGAARGQLYQIIMALLAASLAGALFQITRGLAIVRIQGGMNAGLQAALWDRVLELPTTFFSKYTAGELTSRTMGIQAINNILSETVVTSILGGIFAVFNLLLLFYYSPKLALVAMLIVGCGCFVTGWAGKARVRHLKTATALQQKITGIVFQFISGMSKLRITGSETKAYGIWANLFSRQRQVAFKMEQIQNRLEIFNSAYPHLAVMAIFAAYAVLVFGEQTVYDEALSTGEFLAFNAAFGIFIVAAIEMSNGMLSIMTIQPYYENILPILTTLPEADDSRAAPGELQGEIEVSNVCFRYIKDGPLILNDLSIHIKAHQFVAIVGGSGSGKSTLLRLLLGFEHQEAGSIFYDSKELSGIDIRMVRRQIGVVLQNAQLMSGDLLTNIIGASVHLTIDDAWDAARAVGLAEDIEDMPMGMHTVIAEGGGGLSGGQRQRIVIARAIVHKPKILYFDEATSALDNRTQAMVTESLEKLDATRVVIAHRLSTIRNADCIFAIDHGRLMESGTYNELMEQDGYFAKLAKRQIA